MYNIIILILILCIGIFIAWRLLSTCYSLPCPSWLAWLVELENPFTSVTQSRNVIEQLELTPAMVVLDAGCGPGRITLPLAHTLSQGQVVALDIQKEMLEKVRKKANAENLQNITFHNAALGAMSLGENRFDRAVMSAVLGEIPDQRAALAELFAALKPGGILLISETRFDPHYQRYQKVLKLAQSIGFVERKYIPSFFAYSLLLQK